MVFQHGVKRRKQFTLTDRGRNAMATVYRRSSGGRENDANNDCCERVLRRAIYLENRRYIVPGTTSRRYSVCK